MAEQTFLQKYGKLLTIVLVLIVFAVITWYLFFKDDKTSDSNGSNGYKPSAKAKALANGSNKGWQQPNGSGAWWATYLIGGKEWDNNANAFKNNSPGWYESNERNMNGWFKGMNLNPNVNNEAYWREAKEDIIAYMNSTSKKDFDSIKVGEFLTLS